MLPLALVLLVLGVTAPATAADFPNGRATKKDLAPIASGRDCPGLGGQLQNHAAAAYNTFALAEGRLLPINTCLSAYRTLAQQVSLWNNCPAICARPGSSAHGLGRAVDVPSEVQALMRAHGAPFSWRKIEVFSEPWHFSYVGGFSRPDPGIHLKRPVLTTGSGGPGQQRYVKEVQRHLRRHGQRAVTVDGEFGRRTGAALITFQVTHRLPNDRVVNRVDWRELRGPVTDDPSAPKPVPAPGQDRGS